MDRRLSAILAADVADYSRLMGVNEAETLSALTSFRKEILGPTVAGWRGKIVKSMGDGWLIEFGSASEAVNCALAVQERLDGNRVIRLRIGLHVGDVTHLEDDIFGDGVNIAARLEALAEPGGIAISDPAYSSLDGTLTPSFDDAGLQALKNIERPIRVWNKGGIRPQSSSELETDRLSGYPRLTIQPVETSDDRTEVLELAEGLTGDMDATLSGVRWLISTVKTETQTNEYALRCTLRSRGDRLRLEARLFDPSGVQIWSKKRNGDLAESFDWQDESSDEIAVDVITTILDAEIARLSSISEAERTAKECLVYGFMQFHLANAESFDASITSYMRAMEKDPSLADAYAEAILTTFAGMTVGLEVVVPFYENHFEGWLQNGRSLGVSNPFLEMSLALADFKVSRDVIPLRNANSRALRSAPSDAHVLHYAGWCSLWSGETSTAYRCFRKFSDQFGNAHPFAAPAMGGAATAAAQLGDCETAISIAQSGLELSKSYPTFFAALAAGYAMSGKLEEANAAMKKYRALVPTRTVSSWKLHNDYGGSEGGERYFEALRQAGLPA